MTYLGVWNNFHLKCLSLYESLNSFKVHPPVGQELLEKEIFFPLKGRPGFLQVVSVEYLKLLDWFKFIHLDRDTREIEKVVLALTTKGRWNHGTDYETLSNTETATYMLIRYLGNLQKLHKYHKMNEYHLILESHNEQVSIIVCHKYKVLTFEYLKAQKPLFDVETSKDGQ